MVLQQVVADKGDLLMAKSYQMLHCLIGCRGIICTDAQFLLTLQVAVYQYIRKIIFF